MKKVLALVAVVTVLLVAIPTALHGVPQQESRDEKAEREIQEYVLIHTRKLSLAKPGEHALKLADDGVFKKFDMLPLQLKFVAIKLNYQIIEPEYKIDKKMVAAIYSAYADLYDSKQLNDWVFEYMMKNQDYVLSFSKAMGSVKVSRKAYAAVSLNYFRIPSVADRDTYLDVASRVYKNGAPDFSLMTTSDNTWLDSFIKSTMKKGVTRQEALESLFRNGQD